MDNYNKTITLDNGMADNEREVIRMDVSLQIEEYEEQGEKKELETFTIKLAHHDLRNDPREYSETYNDATSRMYYWYGGNRNEMGKYAAMVKDTVFKSLKKEGYSEETIYECFAWALNIDPIRFKNWSKEAREEMKATPF